MTRLEDAIILNVDDQDAQRYVKSRDLRRAGFRVVEAKTGNEALHMVEEHRPPVVLLDVQLPDISGLEVCQYIKQKYPDVMVLMTSATFVTSTDRTLGLDSGADSYLIQPSEPLELAAAINALLRLFRSELSMRELNQTLEERVQARVADLAEANAKLRAEIVQRQKAEAALVQAQKMEAVGQLTGGLAHDFNNLLTAVVGNLELIRARSTDPRIQHLAESAFKAADRGSKLTAQLLAFSRTQKIATVPVDVNGVIEGVLELLQQSLGAKIAIKADLDPGLPSAMADVNQLELAILNLAINARDAMPEGGLLTITTGQLAGDASAITLAVTDTGCGMTAQVAARAFEPFFTTKPTGRGTGLGLSQVYGIARQIGGDVTLESTVDSGTTVTLLLPRSAEAAAGWESRVMHAARSRNSERVLIVDDDPDVRELISTFLSDLGYEVEDVPHGQAGLKVLGEFDPDLLVLDFAMPGMNGAEMARAARQLKSELKILFVSGFADTAGLEAAAGVAPLLRKPFRPSELAAAVRSALDATAPEAQS